MKRFAFYLFLLAILAGNIAQAQKTIMSGKLVDENGKPVPNAEIKVTGHKVYYKVKTDNKGLYTSPEITPASYHVLIDANGKYYTTERVKISKPGEMKQYHNFTLAGNEANLTIVEEKNPIPEAKTNLIETDYAHTTDDFPTRRKRGDFKAVKSRDAKDDNMPEKKEENIPDRKSDNGTVKIIPGEKVPQSK